MTALVIAILGAESTGKTQLAQALAQALAQGRGVSSTWVPEWLRLWCEREGRTPRPHEQAGIAQEQHRRIMEAASRHEVVVADTTAMMTAIYSHFLFQDKSLMPMAQEHHRHYALTLLTANDLPWQADGLQRDGAHVREPVLRMIEDALGQAGVKAPLITGSGDERLHSALQAVEAELGSRLLNRA